MVEVLLIAPLHPRVAPCSGLLHRMGYLFEVVVCLIEIAHHQIVIGKVDLGIAYELRFTDPMRGRSRFPIVVDGLLEIIEFTIEPAQRIESATAKERITELF